MSKHSFVPNKPIPLPLGGEALKSYGDRLLWHQLGLQLHDHHHAMLTEQEYIDVVTGFYPEAVRHNVELYRSYFNNKHESMGFRSTEMPVHVEFAKGSK
ncbi:hypothetical protein NG895_09480 [Aeoliella sp. ICT_H6.2]|uniref:Uncharacterized protein n=1 Tax=Aeoliella straminimaris TaxID=2954799 RepID=A0A9X2F9J7_9BACT|nr:hypothetical protein [Aeoliella straminimaris]MCO6044138.1 hypothetical protein [Aeoliella straminimaris]